MRGGGVSPPKTRGRKRPYAARATELIAYVDRIVRTIEHFQLEAQREDSLAHLKALRQRLVVCKGSPRSAQRIRAEIATWEAIERWQWAAGAARRDEWRASLLDHDVYERFAHEAALVARVGAIADRARHANPLIEAHRGPLGQPSPDWRAIKAIVKKLLPRPK